ncbi:hypothetical protein [Streptomyces sp. NPDC057582]|uniref:hypothetical protein n=1 Tax=Streptomyces sp. NPDC057582 TaxID=3346174 RepID=UPI00368A19A7
MTTPAGAIEQEVEIETTHDTVPEDRADHEHEDVTSAPAAPQDDEGEAGWDWHMPPNVIDTRHYDVIETARQGRCNEAADLAALGEREDITAHGINSDEAVSWLATRAQVADLCGNRDQATQLRATVARIRQDDDRAGPAHDITPALHREPHQPAPTDDDPTAASLRRLWPAAATIVALSLAIAFVWDNPKGEEKQRQQREERAAAAAYKGKAGAAVTIDGVKAHVVADWSHDRKSVVLALHPYYDMDKNARYLRIDAADKSASDVRGEKQLPKDPEIVVPVKDPSAAVTVRVAMAGKDWEEGSRAASRTIRLSPTGVSFDAKTGKQLPSDL